MGLERFKVKELATGQLPRWRQYAEWVVGKTDLVSLLKFELITFFLGSLPGALGLYLRSKLYPFIFGEAGSNVVFGRGITLRHPHKIRIGQNVIIDDYCVLDAKGWSNTGISIGDGVFIGRNSILYCKDGDIEIQSQANISFNCIVVSSHRVAVGSGSMVAAHCYIMSGGSYDYKHSEIGFVAQDGYAKGPTVIGEGCWLGANVVVLDGVSIGNHSVIGAGAVVTKAIPENSVAVGVPARVVELLDEELIAKIR
jgi:acetyltransferase-like isoleucine patch superfamily enzyme